ncbi:MAG: outer membrane protein assembly factor BamA [Candidatus Delongbacteria bacterium]|nr:outer membrane protein assembly factor BamA [Candidatus Delongbacteria bacterium]MBN2833405.1 outer membrane protein assembly factor BamA [Candidatus Delongbacteria bacterium]
MVYKVIIVISLFLTVFLMHGQEAKGLKIEGVKVKGNDQVSEELIINTSGFSVGRTIYGEDIQYAIKKLWGLDLFSNIVIEAEDAIGSNVFINIIVEVHPRLSNIKVRGADNIDQDEIVEAVTKIIRAGQVVKQSTLSDIKNELKAIYKKKNYLLADFEIEKMIYANNNAELIINIIEGHEVYIETITFHGNYNFDKDDLLDSFENIHEDAWWRDGKYDKTEFKADIQNLKNFYQNNGFKDIEVIRDTTYYNDMKDELYIDIWLKEGKKYFFGNVSFEGNTINNDEALKNVLQFEKGEEFSKQKLDMSLYNGLYPMYQDRGYLRSRVIPEEQIVGEDTISYNFKIVEGVKARIRKVDVTGNSRTNEKVIRRELSIYPGDIFNRSKLMRSQRDVFMLNYFSNVVPDARQINDNEVDLVFDVTEKSTEQAQASVSYSGNDGLILSLGFVFNNFSFNDPFVRGDGQKLSTQIDFSKTYWKYSISAEEPWLMDTPTLIGVSGDYSKRQESYSDTRIIGGALKLGRRFAWADNWLKGVWIYSIENVEYTNVEDDAIDTYDIYEGKQITSSSLTQYLIRNNKDKPEFPTSGTEFTLMTKIAGNLFGGDEQFHKHKFEFMWYQPLIKDRLVIANQYLFGAMDKFSTESYISAREYFYMGGSGLSGSEPLRGYDDNSVGPIKNGYFVGGRNTFKTSAELRLKFTDDPMLVYGLLFFDAGNVWEDFEHTDLFDLRKGAGLGIRVFMPMIGMMGLDYAYGFDKYDYYGKRYGEWLPHFRLGMNF